MKSILLLLLTSIVSFSNLSLYAQDSKNFAHPLQVEPISIYSKIKLDAMYWDKRTNESYEQNRNISLEGEYSFWKYFSIISSVGRSDYRRTDSEPSNTYDRWNFGLKINKIYEMGNSSLLVGGGVRLFDRKRGIPLVERENPDYYLVRPNFGLGYRCGRFEILSEIRFQTETNRTFKEENLQEFRRYFQFGIAPSYSLTKSVRVFFEFEYREPYDKIIDTNTRFFNFYPGITYRTESIGTFSVSILQSILTREENAMDRGIRFSYFYFLDQENSNSRNLDSTSFKNNQ